MASISVIPEKFSAGDFVSWLRNFDCCATANGWEDEDKLKKLPAFLRGPSAAYFHGLPAAQKDTYEHLTAALKIALCPTVNREQFYADFESRFLRPDEDPSLFQWELEDLLSKADPDSSTDARSALLARQFMKGLPADIRIRLLEFNPTPSLTDMREFVQRHRAIHRPPASAFASGHCSANNGANSASTKSSFSDANLNESIQHLTAAVAALTANQQQLQSTLETQQAQPRFQRNQRKWRDRVGGSQRRCFRCNEVGHLARFCPMDIHWCSICNEWGHPSGMCNATRHERLPTDVAVTDNQRQETSRGGSGFQANHGRFPYSSSTSHVSTKSLNFKGVPH